MKIKSTLLVAVLFLFMINASAKNIDLATAQKAATNFIYVAHAKYGKVKQLGEIHLSNPYIYKENGTTIFYAFDTDPGFIIISAEDAYVPVIGYSFAGSFVFDQAPAHYRGFIRNYADQINYIRDNQVEQQPEITREWEDLMVENIAAYPISRDLRDVGPLLMNNWNQGNPYNIYCPEDPAGPGGHTWVGCVATAMAQIMYYWRYPEVGTGQHCYIPGNISYGEQCADFGNTYYSWEGMNNSIDNKNPYANAELQYHCAVSVNMNFSPSGSGSFSWLLPGRLDDYFQYHNAEYLEKQNFSQTNWINLLKEEIDAGHPLYYSGYNPTEGGHAFVCDGYQGDDFHFNFGWSGNENGYYSLYDVNGFSSSQACVRYFVPSDPSYPYRNTGDITITEKSGSITDGSGPIADYLNNNTATWLIDPQTAEDSISDITLNFIQFDVAPGDTVSVYNGATTNDSLLGSFSGTGLPPQIISTSNKMLIVFTTNDSNTASGWYAEFFAHSPVWCLGLTEFTEPYGTFDDGSGPFFYHEGATCMYRIKPQYANTITLSFNYFETEEFNDKVRVLDGNVLIAELSGNTIPDPIVATSGSMFITWSTNNSVNMQGWEAYYEVDNVGIDEGGPVNRLNFYPNPVSEYLNISFHLERKDVINISLFNITGQQVNSMTSSLAAGDHNTFIDVKNLPEGVYLLRVSTGSATLIRKVIVR